MSYLKISQNKHNLEKRASIVRAIRNWFWDKGFTEIEAPLFVTHAGQEPYLDPVEVSLHDEKQNEINGYLHTSPEYAMKKCLAAGFEQIFYLGKCFRDYESFGGLHYPEFTMLEWYRTHHEYETIMDDCESLIHSLIPLTNDHIKNYLEKKLHRLSMKQLWQKHCDINLDDYLTLESMNKLAITKGYSSSNSYEDAFYKIFLNEIEPKIGIDQPTIVHSFPVSMAALATAQNNGQYANRFELYCKGIEMANAFTELTDAGEQRKRFEQEQDKRKSLGKKEIPIDESFLEAVEAMPPSAGIALGIDRLVMLLLQQENINNIIIT